MSFASSVTVPVIAAVLVFAIVYMVFSAFNIERGVVIASFLAIFAFLIALKKSLTKES